MFIVDIDKLYDGDILLIKGEPRAQEIMQSEYTHAILYISKSSCIESDGYGVQSFNPQRRLFKNENEILVLRLKNNIPNRDSIIRQSILKARSLIGTEYGQYEARKVLTREQSNPNLNRQFCTRLISQSFQFGGLNLVDNADYPSPSEIIHSPFLYIAQNSLKKATDEEIGHTKEQALTDIQTDSINGLFEKARGLSGKDIQTFEQISHYLIENKDDNFDKEFTQYYINSSYYKLWELDFKRNPHNYNYELFKTRYSTEEKRLKAISLLKDVSENLNELYLSNYITHLTLYKKYGFKYFNANMRLYLKLLEINSLREDIIEKATKEFNL